MVEILSWLSEQSCAVLRFFKFGIEKQINYEMLFDNLF